MVSAHHVEAAPAVIEEGAHALAQEIHHLALLFEGQRIDTSVDAFEVGQAGQQLRSSAHRAEAGRTNESGGAGADAFDGLGAKTGFFYVYARRKIRWHVFSPSSSRS